MRTWTEIEAKRAKLGLSRAAMCRRAGISESTVFKGLRKKTRPIASVLHQVELVLAMEEQVQKDDAA